MDLRERCYRCGHTWGVTMPPRERVLCTPCARPAPNRDAARYWRLRATTGWPTLRHLSPEWWDQQTSLADLRYAAAIAAA